MAKQCRTAAARTKPTIRPIDIELPEGVPLGGGTFFVRLRTLADLDQFWMANHDRLPYSAEGSRLKDGNYYLTECEWIFGPTKASVAKTVMRWDALGTRCEWYDWAAKDPQEWAFFFIQQANRRNKKQASGDWSEADEAEYTRFHPDTYTGWWTLVDLPLGMDHSHWFPCPRTELDDPNLPIDQVALLFQAQTFDMGVSGGSMEVEFRDPEQEDEYIAFLKDEERKGFLCYGAELMDAAGCEAGELSSR